MEDITDPFKHMQVKKILFAEKDPDEEDTLNISSWKTGLSIRRSLSCGNIRDEDFYSSEDGKNMILRDQQAQAGNVLENVTSCSSWAINSQHPLGENFHRTVNRQCRELFLEYADFTSCLSLKASTPKSSNGSFLFPPPTTSAVSKTEDKILKSSCHNARRDSALFPMLLYGAPATNELHVPNIVGSALKMKKTPTLNAGEIPEDPAQACSSSKGIQRFQSYDFPGGEETTLRLSVKSNARSLNAEGDLWIVQPQALELDANGKGRLLLINKSSSRNLKFKIVFDGKWINVCPQSGNLRSNCHLGLRVVVPRCKNENPKVIEEILKITCGGQEKRVPVKFYREHKIKSIKDRSYRCF